jgi:hypothetical protein
MSYVEKKNLSIVQHGQGVTVGMNKRQYAVFVEAIGNLHAEREDAVSEGMVRDIRERGL